MGKGGSRLQSAPVIALDADHSGCSSSNYITSCQVFSIIKYFLRALGAQICIFQSNKSFQHCFLKLFMLVGLPSGILMVICSNPQFEYYLEWISLAFMCILPAVQDMFAEYNNICRRKFPELSNPQKYSRYHKQLMSNLESVYIILMIYYLG